MAVYTFKLPDIGEGIAEAEIAEWKVAAGDVIVEDQALCDMLTDKAAVEIPSPVAGTVLELKGEAGEMVAVGGALVVIETEAESAADTADAQAASEPDERGAAAPAPPPVAPQASAKTEVERQPQSSPAPTAPVLADKPLASPAVRRRAREMGIDLARVRGSGPAGRICHEDLDAHRGAAPSTGAQPRHGVHEVKIIGLRRKIAAAMQSTMQRIPHFAYVEECDVTELEALRQQLNAARRDDQPRLTILPFLIRALVQVAGDFPQINARFDDEAGVLQQFDALHVGIAAQTDSGLVVPVVRHAETLDVWAMGTQIQRLAEAARQGRATREELSGSTITISSLGRMGGIVSTPVINAPEVAIVGVNKMVERPVIQRGMVVPRMMMNLSSSFDHRIVDGWDAASFIQAIKQRLESPALLFMQDAP